MGTYDEVWRDGIGSVLDEATRLLSAALGADKVEVLLHEPERAALARAAVSDTPLARQQRALGLDWVALANGGECAAVFTGGRAFMTGHLESEPGVPRGATDVLGVRSEICVPLQLGGERRGVLCAQSTRAEFFTEGDLRLVEAVSFLVDIASRRPGVRTWPSAVTTGAPTPQPAQPTGVVVALHARRGAVHTG